METVQKIQKVTSKGQITLPISYRNAVGTDSFVMRESGKKLEVIPAYLVIDPPHPDDVVIFDAVRDNNGKPIMASEILKLIKRIDADERARKISKKGKSKATKSR